ncbi:MATE family efflux transporter [Candidatus Bipolaricaulota bacterium]|nr:MATE family efflux transporter [Candidatus Bipolaricaulota bacterium]
MANTEKSTRVENLKDDILSGPIIKTLLTLGWPVIVSNVIQTLYNVIDTYWLGRLGNVAVSAPTVGFPVVFLLISVGMGFSIAGVSLVSQHTGAGSEENANRAAGQVVGFMFLSAMILSALGYAVAPFLLENLMGVPEDVFPKALSYIRIIFSGLPLMFLFFSFRSMMRGVGDMITPMVISSVSALLNGVVLDPILIFGLGSIPSLGVSGAAVATISSRGLAALAGLYLLFFGEVEIKLNFHDLLLKWRWLKQILKIGLPSSIGQAGTAVGSVILMGLISRLGVVAVTAYGIGQRIIRILNIAIWGLASPLTTMVGQNIGAEQEDRADLVAKRAFGLSFSVILVFALIAFGLRRPVFRIFIDDPEVVKTGARFITIFIWSIPFFGIFRLVSSVFRGSGHTRPPMVMSLIRLLPLRIGISFLLAFGAIGVSMGSEGIWLGMSISNLVTGIIGFIWYLTGSWKERTIEERETEGTATEEVQDSTESASLSSSSAE